MPYMRDVGELEKNRDYYLRTRFANLNFLFEKRFSWMNDHIGEADEVLEVGCGVGVTKLFINRGNVTLSDVVAHPWVDRQEDALRLSYRVDGDISEHHLMRMDLNSLIHTFSLCLQVQNDVD